MEQHSKVCSCGLAVEDRAGLAYNEAAFRHFLAIERKRVQRSTRSFLLLLVTLNKSAGSMDGRITPDIAQRLFATLSLTLREVDFIGWYREERAIGAVLSQGEETPPQDASRTIATRMTGVLRENLPTWIAKRLQVRVLQIHRSLPC